MNSETETAPGRNPGAVERKFPMCDKRITPPTRSGSDNSLPFDCEAACLISWGLHSVVADARFALQGTVEWKCSLALAQLILDVERLRRTHAETCPECSAEDTCPS
jgi:hypothetical protein